MNDKVRMILMEELDISPSEFKKRFESEQVSPEDNIIKTIALRCGSISNNPYFHSNSLSDVKKFPSLDLYCGSLTSRKE